MHSIKWSTQRILHSTSKSCCLWVKPPCTIYVAHILSFTPFCVLDVVNNHRHIVFFSSDRIHQHCNALHLPNPDWWMWFQSLVWSTWFPSPHSSCLCDSWGQGITLHQTPIKAHFNEGKLITAPVTDAGWSASDADLCLQHPAGHNQSEKKKGVDGGACRVWEIVRPLIEEVHMLLLHRQTSMLISHHSCCYTEETTPKWFMCCQARGLASSLTSERLQLPWKGHIWAILATWGPDDRWALCSDLISIHRQTWHGTVMRRYNTLISGQSHVLPV